MVPWQPHRRHHSSESTTRHLRIARPGCKHCSVTSNPSSSTRENVVTSAGQKVVWDKRTSGNETHSLDTLILSRGPRSIPDHTPKGLHSRLRRATLDRLCFDWQGLCPEYCAKGLHYSRW